jgi:hypothetical protein
MALIMTAASSEWINVAIVAAFHDSLGWTGICVGMDTSMASLDHNHPAVQVLTGGQKTCEA